MQRPSFYRDIHKGLRSLLFDIVRKSGQLDFTDAPSIARFRNDLKDAIDFLEFHAHHENRFVAPILERCAPKLAADMASDHQEQEEQLQSLLAALDLIDPGSDDAAVKGHEFTVLVSRVAGEFMVHMAQEEEELMPAMWKALDDSTILQIHQQVMAATTPERTATAMRWVLPSMSAPDRVAALAAARASAPKEAFAFLRGIARTVLTAEEDAALERGLEEAEARVA